MKKKFIKQLIFLLLVLILTLSLAACKKETTIDITNGNTVQVNTDLKLTALVKENGKTVEDASVTWSVSEKSGGDTGAAITNGVLKALRTGVCVVTAKYGDVSDSMDITIKKANQTAPAALTATVLSGTSISATQIPGAEYSIDNGVTWQDSNVFTGLTANTTYTVKARLKETSNYYASDIITAASVTTLDGVAAEVAAFEAFAKDFFENFKVNLTTLDAEQFFDYAFEFELRYLSEYELSDDAKELVQPTWDLVQLFMTIAEFHYLIAEEDDDYLTSDDMQEIYEEVFGEDGWCAMYAGKLVEYGLDEIIDGIIETFESLAAGIAAEVAMFEALVADLLENFKDILVTTADYNEFISYVDALIITYLGVEGYDGLSRNAQILIDETWYYLDVIDCVAELHYAVVNGEDLSDSGLQEEYDYLFGENGIYSNYSVKVAEHGLNLDGIANAIIAAFEAEATVAAEAAAFEALAVEFFENFKENLAKATDISHFISNYVFDIASAYGGEQGLSDGAKELVEPTLNLINAFIGIAGLHYAVINDDMSPVGVQEAYAVMFGEGGLYSTYAGKFEEYGVDEIADEIIEAFESLIAKVAAFEAMVTELLENFKDRLAISADYDEFKGYINELAVIYLGENGSHELSRSAWVLVDSTLQYLAGAASLATLHYAVVNGDDLSESVLQEEYEFLFGEDGAYAGFASKIAEYGLNIDDIANAVIEAFQAEAAIEAEVEAFLALVVNFFENYHSYLATATGFFEFFEGYADAIGEAFAGETAGEGLSGEARLRADIYMHHVEVVLYITALHYSVNGDNLNQQDLQGAYQYLFNEENGEYANCITAFAGYGLNLDGIVNAIIAVFSSGGGSGSTDC